ncbi:polar amino acid transport system substrate-binding protein [Geobacter sp. DSM 9736]|nr:polar amino acid transport system substrate-binding protein [Geobacter sp. DSM 9736]
MQSDNRHGFITFCILALLLFSSRSALPDTYVLNTDNTYPRSTPDGKGFQDLIIKEMFRRIGHKAKIVHVPSERALANANEGIDDGDFVRIAGLDKKYPNLVMVPEKVSEFEFAAFSRNPSIRISGWESLKPYNVGIITGWKILETNVSGTRSLTKVKDDKALFDLLVNDRADIVVFDRLQGAAFIKRERLAGIKPLEPLLARRDMYLYLNRRHADLVPRLAAALREMKQDGTWQRIMSAAF